LNDVEVDIWPAFTDFVISVLFIVVVFIFGILFSGIARSSTEVEEMRDRQRRVRTELESRLNRLTKTVEIPEADGNLQRVILRVDEQGRGGVLFERGRATLREEGKHLLDEIVRVLEANRDRFDTIQVEGHTDDVPTGGIYPSNWELSAARAGAVVSYVISRGARLESWRFSANGRAEYRPYGVSESEMNLERAPNPRGGPDLRYIIEANQLAGGNPLSDNSNARRNRRIEIILTYKLTGNGGAQK
jgi:flagellar motor protein MotB